MTAGYQSTFYSFYYKLCLSQEWYESGIIQSQNQMKLHSPPWTHHQTVAATAELSDHSRLQHVTTGFLENHFTGQVVTCGREMLANSNNTVVNNVNN